MNHAGMLAHLRDQFHVPPENLATEALAYILNSSSNARKGFSELTRRIIPDFDELVLFETQGMSGDDPGIPDLIGVAHGEKRVLLGEVKFDAGLTSNQPVTYLERLQREHGRGILLFVVPERRVSMVWSELRRRCNAAGMQLSEDSINSKPLTFATCQFDSGACVTLGITPWSEVLKVVERAVSSDEDSTAYWDLRQLQAMCERQDNEAFAPFESSDLDPRIGQRIIDYTRLVDDIVEDLLADGTVSIDGLRPVVTRDRIGRYISISDWVCFWGLIWSSWATRRSTPFWLLLNDLRAKQNQGLSSALTDLKLEDPPRLISENWEHFIPIFPRTQTDRDEVRNDLANQIREVSRLLSKSPPPANEE